MILFLIIFLRTLKDEDEDEIEDLTLDPESIDDAVETFDDAEALELEN